MNGLWIIFILMFVCMVYLTVDWIMDEIRQAKREREELED